MQKGVLASNTIFWAGACDSVKILQGMMKRKLLREDMLPSMALNQWLLNEFMDLLSEYEAAMSKVEPIHATQALQPVLGAHDTWSPHSCSSLTFRHFLICGRTRTTTNGRPTHVIVVPLYLSLCFSEHIIFTILLIFSYQ